MDCDQIERRLNRLLDNRQRLSTDPELTAHLRRCGACRRLASGYESLMLAEAVASDEPRLSTDFASRVVSAVDRRSRHAEGGRMLHVALAVAAMLLLAVWPIHALRSTGGAGRETLTVKTPPIQETAPAAASIAGSADPLGHGQIWLATGRGLATLPVAVRRASHFAEGENLSSTLRPMVTSIADTLETLLEMLPDEPRPERMPNGGTGFCLPAPPSALA